MYLIKIILKQKGIILNSNSCKLPVIEIIFDSGVRHSISCTFRFSDNQ